MCIRSKPSSMYGELFRNGSHAQCLHVKADGSCSIYYCVGDGDEKILLWVRQRAASATWNECDNTNSFTISQCPYAFTHSTTSNKHSADRENISIFSATIFTLCTNRTFFGDGFCIGAEVRLFYILMEISLFLGMVRVCAGVARRLAPYRICIYILNMYFVHSWPFMRRSFCDKSFLCSCFAVMVLSLLLYRMPNVLAEREGVSVVCTRYAYYFSRCEDDCVSRQSVYTYAT